MGSEDMSVFGVAGALGSAIDGLLRRLPTIPGRGPRHVDGRGGGHLRDGGHGELAQIKKESDCGAASKLWCRAGLLEDSPSMVVEARNWNDARKRRLGDGSSYLAVKTRRNKRISRRAMAAGRPQRAARYEERVFLLNRPSAGICEWCMNRWR